MKFYVDTSVWGGYEDEEFSEWTIPYIEQARQGRFTIVLSDVTIGELQKAPESVRELPTTISPEFIELVSITDEQLALADKYVEEGSFAPKISHGRATYRNFNHSKSGQFSKLEF